MGRDKKTQGEGRVDKSFQPGVDESRPEHNTSSEIIRSVYRGSNKTKWTANGRPIGRGNMFEGYSKGTREHIRRSFERPYQTKIQEIGSTLAIGVT